MYGNLWYVVFSLLELSLGVSFFLIQRLPTALRSFIVYKFTCAGCQSCYIRETRRHLATWIKEHLVTGKKSHIMKHLLENKTG